MSDYYADDIVENKFGITDPDVLHNIEERIVAEKTSILLSEIYDGPPNEVFLKHVHLRLFEDIYNFAGRFREVDITKSDSSTPFCYARFLDKELYRIFDTLEKQAYLADLDRSSFARQLALLAADLNALHPFREGNGRAIRLYLILLADQAGYLLDYSRVQAAEIIDADKRAFEGNDAALLALYDAIELDG